MNNLNINEKYVLINETQKLCFSKDMCKYKKNL